MCLAEPAVERQPGIDFDLILRVDRDQAPVRILRQRCDRGAPIVVNHVEELIVLLSETVKARARVIWPRNPRHRPLSPFVFGGAVLRGGAWEIVWIAYIVGAVVMEE